MVAMPRIELGAPVPETGDRPSIYIAKEKYGRDGESRTHDLSLPKRAD